MKKTINFLIVLVTILLGGIVLLQLLPLVCETILFIDQAGVERFIQLGSPEWVARLTLCLFWTLMYLTLIWVAFCKGR